MTAGERSPCLHPHPLLSNSDSFAEHLLGTVDMQSACSYLEAGIVLQVNGYQLLEA